VRSIIYRKDTGEIVWVMQGSENDCLYSLRNSFGMAEHTYIEGVADPDRHYVDVSTEELRERQPFDLTIAENVVSGIPEGTEIMLPNRTWVVADASGTFEPEVDHRQTIALRLRHPHYLDEEIEVFCAP